MVKKTFFQKDTWLYEKPLCVLFLDLFKFCEQQNILVNQVLNEPQTISFTRWLVDSLLSDQQMILNDMNNLNFSSREDLVSQKFGSLGRFTVKSVYNAMTANESGPYHEKIWKAKIPAKIKIFLWLLMNNAILTKDKSQIIRAAHGQGRQRIEI